MGRIIKYLAILVGAVLALVIVAGILVSLLFDPNDFRDEIQAEVKEATGRDLVIEGDIGLKIFPWLALDVGKASFGNAAGFGNEPMASFDRATLSVKMLPMLLRRELTIGTASLESLKLNLAIDRNGRSNWQDLAKEGTKEETDAADRGRTFGLQVSSINISDAAIVYADARSGNRYTITNANLKTGKVAAGTGVSVEGGLSFDLQPKGMTGDVEVESNVLFDPGAGSMAFDNLQISGFVEGVSHVPVTFGIKTNVDVGDATVALNDIVLALDDTVFRGAMKLPRGGGRAFEVDLAADKLDLNPYIAPAGEDKAAADAAAPAAIPTDLVRSLNARGSLKVGKAILGGLEFDNVDLGMNAAKGKLRLHPVSADMFGGSYKGDVILDASGSTAVLSVNETIQGVSIKSLAGAMFEKQNISGAINGNFKLTGRGNDAALIQKSLNGTMSLEMLDGAWEGVDFWYELRRARALLKKETMPEPSLPPRTKFSSVKMTGVVTDGIFRSNDFAAEMPFMQVTGGGSVNIPEATVDYRLSARVLNKPELAGKEATAEELKDLTKTVIPVRISGPLSDPSIKPDVEGMLKKRVEEELKDKLFDKLLGGDKPAAETPEGEQPAEEEKKPEDEIKDKLKDIFRR